MGRYFFAMPITLNHRPDTPCRAERARLGAPGWVRRAERGGQGAPGWVLSARATRVHMRRNSY